MSVKQPNVITHALGIVETPLKSSMLSADPRYPIYKPRADQQSPVPGCLPHFESIDRFRRCEVCMETVIEQDLCSLNLFAQDGPEPSQILASPTWAPR